MKQLSESILNDAKEYFDSEIVDFITKKINSLEEETEENKTIITQIFNDTCPIGKCDLTINIFGRYMQVLKKYFCMDESDFKNYQAIMKENNNAKKENKKSIDELFDIKVNYLKYNKLSWYFIKLYESFSKSDKAFEFLKKFKLTACPYCNENYAYTTEKKGIRPQFDHFLPKSKYPLFAVCFYNLVPSCPVCNQNKSNNNEEFIHPFYHDFDKIKRFKIIPSKATIIEDKDFKIEFCNKEANESLNKANNTIKSLKLEERYNMHRDIAFETIQKKYIYTPEMKKEIAKMLGICGCGGSDMLEKIIFGVSLNRDEINKRPMAKLVADILEDLK